MSNFVTPWAIGRQAPLSMGFSRQEYWSGLPCVLQEIFPTQRSNLCLLHCRQTLDHLSHQGSSTVSQFLHFKNDNCSNLFAQFMWCQATVPCMAPAFVTVNISVAILVLDVFLGWADTLVFGSLFRIFISSLSGPWHFLITCYALFLPSHWIAKPRQRPCLGQRECLAHSSGTLYTGTEFRD